MLSVLSNCISTGSVRNEIPREASARSTTSSVPDPVSRITSGSFFRSAAAISSCRSERFDEAVTSTSSSSINVS